MAIMLNSELIELVTVLDIAEDDSGFGTDEKIVKTEVFAGIKSVGRTEYYEAVRAGVQVSIIFLVDADDFSLSEHIIEVEGKQKKVKASKIIYDGTEYLIHRTYRNNFGMLEITCREVE